MSEDDLICINPPEAKPPQKKQNTVRPARVAWFCGVLLAVLVGVALLLEGETLNLDRVRRFFTYYSAGKDPNFGHFAPVSGGVRACAAFADGFAAANSEALYLLQADGEKQEVCQLGMTDPAIALGNERLAVYDAGGSQIVLADQDGAVRYQAAAEGPLIDLELSDEDCMGYVMLAEPYKAVLVVLDREQRQIYRWNSGTHYFNCCAVSSDAELLTAVQLGQEEERFASTAVLFHTDERQPSGSVALGEQVIFQLAFLDDDTLCAIGEHAAVFFNADGQTLGQYDYGEAELTGFATAKDTVCLALKQAEATLLISIDETGAVRRSLEQTEPILGLSGCGKYVAALEQTGVTVYRRDLTVYSQNHDIQSVTHALMRPDGTVIAVGEGAQLLFYD